MLYVRCRLLARACRVACPAATALLALPLLIGCALGARNADDAPFELSEDYANNVVRYTVQNGDRLGDIALEFTGQIDQWRAIAEHNGIEDPRSLRAGTRIEIPTLLIPGYAERREARRQQLARQQAESAGAASSLGSASAGSDNTIGTPGAETPDDAAAVEITAVDANRQFELETANSGVGDGTAPSASTSDDRSASDTPIEIMGELKIAGTYYPKAVYAQPTSDSELLLRAAPGTRFDYTRRIDGWYEIEITGGQGYLRDADARLVE